MTKPVFPAVKLPSLGKKRLVLVAWALIFLSLSMPWRDNSGIGTLADVVTWIIKYYAEGNLIYGIAGTIWICISLLVFYYPLKAAITLFREKPAIKTWWGFWLTVLLITVLTSYAFADASPLAAFLIWLASVLSGIALRRESKGSEERKLQFSLLFLMVLILASASILFVSFSVLPFGRAI